MLWWGGQAWDLDTELPLIDEDLVQFSMDGLGLVGASNSDSGGTSRLGKAPGASAPLSPTPQPAACLVVPPSPDGENRWLGA